MAHRLPGATEAGLERSCETGRSGWLRSRAFGDGVELLQAWFAGRGYDPHRHDTYAIGLTDVGVQAFDYRGAARTSTPGQAVVLHPDELHDGHAGTPAGFGYRILYVSPARIGAAARAIRGRACALPFAPEPVIGSEALAHAVATAFRLPPEPLAEDSLLVALAAALLDADPSCTRSALPARLDWGAIARARQLLDAETTRVIPSTELEAVTGLTRYDLARQFRAALGTSPYRYSLLRRLDRARAELRRNSSLADVALAAGFADQAHLSRMFKRAFGVSPARYRALEATASRPSVRSRLIRAVDHRVDGLLEAPHAT